MRGFGWGPCCLVTVLASGLLACSGEGDDQRAGAGGGAASGGTGISAAGGAGGATSGAGGGGGTLAIAGAGGAGTSGPGAGAGGRGASAVTQLEACVAYVRGFCDAQARCEIGFVEPAITAAREGCFAKYAVYCPDALFAVGSVRTIDDALACAAAWPAVTCASYERGATPACAVPGTRAANEKCLFGMQCASGLCTEFGRECGVCGGIAHEGETCGSSEGVCVRGTYCDEETWKCVVSPPEDDVPATARVPELGEPCDLPVGCGGESRAQCARDGTTGEYRCQPWPTLGQACRGWCLLGDSYCAQDMTCTALPLDGQPCAMDLQGDTVCALGHACDWAVAPKICHAPPGAGEVCQGPCATGLLCLCDEGSDCAQRHCRHIRLAGEPCVDPVDACLSGATRCENGVCVEVGMQGLFEAKCGM